MRKLLVVAKQIGTRYSKGNANQGKHRAERRDGVIAHAKSAFRAIIERLRGCSIMFGDRMIASTANCSAV